jgi:hypothetical protein
MQRYNKPNDLATSKKIYSLRDNEYKSFLAECCEELRIGLQKEQDVEQVKRLIAFMEEEGWSTERAVSQIKIALRNKGASKDTVFYNQTWTYQTILNAIDTPIKKEMPKPEFVVFYNKIEKRVCFWDLTYSGKCPLSNIPFLDYMNNLDKRKEYDEYLGVPAPEKELKLLSEKAKEPISLEDHLKKYSIYEYSKVDPVIADDKLFEKREINKKTFVFMKKYSEIELNNILQEFKSEILS